MLLAPSYSSLEEREEVMEIQAFGYLGVGSSNLDDWATFATSSIGVQSVDRASSMRAFRMDDRKQRLFIDRAIEPGTQIFGWEVANAAALDLLAARLDGAGVAVKREPAALADERRVAGLISFADPAGNRLEAFHGAHIAEATFKPSRDVSGFRTGPQGMGPYPSDVPRHRRCVGLLQGPVRLSHQRLHGRAVEGLFH